MSLCIAIDAMGGDAGENATIPAVLLLAKRYPEIQFHLYGELLACQPLLRDHSLSNISFVETAHSVLMSDTARDVLRHKKQSSMACAVNAVAMKQADGCISAGNTAALLAISLHYLDRYKGIDRPALCKALPTNSKPSYLLDLGANLGCTADHLVQFAAMGAALCYVLHQNSSPSVQLLNIASEAEKGVSSVQAAADILSKNAAMNYQGFIEADSLYRGDADVIICDGFAGNVALKASEGVARFMTSHLRQAFKRSWYSRRVGLLARPILSVWQSRMNPDRYNGAYLLGLKGTVVKSHGGANSVQFTYALEMLIHQLQQQHSLSLERALSVFLSGSNHGVS